MRDGRRGRVLAGIMGALMATIHPACSGSAPSAKPATTPAPATATSMTTWAEVEPLLRARFALEKVGEFFSWTGESPLPASAGTPQLRAAVSAATSREHAVGSAAMRRCGLAISEAQRAGMALVKDEGLDAGTAKFRERLLDSPRTRRLFGDAVAKTLEEQGIRCSDCVVAGGPRRQVTFEEFVPYLARFVALNERDLAGADDEHVRFHICSGLNGLAGLEPVDPDLAATALSAMFRATSEAKPAAERAGNHVIETWRANRGEPTKERADAINAEVWRKLAADAAFLEGLRPLIAEEAAVSGLDCGDCS